jgi:hypothetical protein
LLEFVHDGDQVLVDSGFLWLSDDSRRGNVVVKDLRGVDEGNFRVGDLLEDLVCDFCSGVGAANNDDVRHGEVLLCGSCIEQVVSVVGLRSLVYKGR